MMMNSPNYFLFWISKKPLLILGFLLFILFTAMAQFASFAMIQHYVKATFGAQPEDISLAFQMTYIGILVTLPIQFRWVNRFDTRNYLLVAFILGITLNLGCLLTENLIIFMILRFFTGITTCMVAGNMLITIFSVLPETKKNVIGVCLFFGSILSVGVLVGIAAAWVVNRMDWKALYYFLIILQLVSILICFAIFNEKTHSRKIPLYQLDYTGSALFAFFAFLLAYAVIYGPKYYWFENNNIMAAFIGSILFLGMFLYRQKTLKHPSIDLRVFRHKKFWFGLLLLIVFFGIKDTINLLYGYAAGVLGWSTDRIVTLGVFNVFGILISTFISIRIVLIKKQNLPKLLFLGFGILLYYHIWIYWNLTPDLSFFNLVFPIFIHGVASGILFAPIIMLCMACLPSFTGMTGVVVCAYCRFITSLNSITGFYTLQQNYNQEFKVGFIENITPYNPILMQQNQAYRNLLITRGCHPESVTHISRALVGKNIGIQSQILTDRAIFILSVYLIGFTLLSLIVFAVLTKLQLKKQSIVT